MTLFVFDFIPEISLEAMRALVRGKLFKVRDCYTAHDSYLCTVSILLYPRCTGSDCTFLECEFVICIRCRQMMRPAWFCKNKTLFFKYSMFFYRPATINRLQLFHWLLSTEFDNWLQLGFSGQIK